MNGNCFTKLSQELLDTSRAAAPSDIQFFELYETYKWAVGNAVQASRVRF